MSEESNRRQTFGSSSMGQAVDGYRLMCHALAALAAALALSQAWVTEDAYVTFRHVQNFLAGNGPVFNAGERVQGFTHPLWFCILAVAGSVCHLYAAAVILGVVLTYLLVLGYGKVIRHAGDDHVLGTVFVTVVLFSCTSILDFQTSGLENALSHWLIVLLVGALLVGQGDPGRFSLMPAMFLVSVLLTNRLDLLFLTAPTILFIVKRAMDGGRKVVALLALIGASLPAIIWFLFATLYYGVPFPNTMYAKVGFKAPTETWAQGISYLLDFLAYEPFHGAVLALAGVVTLVAAGHEVKNRRPVGGPLMALALGIWLQIGYVVFVGGDYIRGRFLTAPLVCATVLAGFVLVRYLNKLQLLGTVAVVLTTGLSAHVVNHVYHVDDARTITAAGILRERLQQPSQLVFNYHSMSNVREWAISLRDYAAKFGPITITYEAVGIAPFQAGPDVHFIDPYGLTDAFVARCKPAPGSRVGHIHHDVPRAYYQSRGSLSLLPDWRRRIAMMDPSLIREARAVAANPDWPNPAARRAYEDCRLLTSGPILSWKRLGLMLRFSLGRYRVGNDLSGGTALGMASINGIVTCNYTPRFGSPQSILDPRDKPEGIRWNDATRCLHLRDSRSVVNIELTEMTRLDEITVQADSDDYYRLAFSRDGKQFGETWTILPVEHFGMRRRRTPPNFSRTAKYLRLRADGGDGNYSVSFLALSGSTPD